MCVQLVKNLLNSMRKRGGKTGDSIDEKPPNPVGTEEENRSFRCFAMGEKPPKPN